MKEYLFLQRIRYPKLLVTPPPKKKKKKKKIPCPNHEIHVLFEHGFNLVKA